MLASCMSVSYAVDISSHFSLFLHLDAIVIYVYKELIACNTLIDFTLDICIYFVSRIIEIFFI